MPHTAGCRGRHMCRSGLDVEVEPDPGAQAETDVLSSKGNSVHASSCLVTEHAHLCDTLGVLSHAANLGDLKGTLICVLPGILALWILLLQSLLQSYERIDLTLLVFGKRSKTENQEKITTLPF